MTKKILVSIICFFLMPILFGCKASYPKEKLLESINILCKKEMGREVECALKGKTLYTVIYIENLIDKDMKFSDKTLDVIQNVLLAVNRVTLSTDAKIDFFIVIAADKTTGISLIFTQYVDDLRRWILSSISRDDFFSRSLTEIYNNSKNRVFDLDRMPDISIQEFVAKQTANIVNKDFEKNLIFQLLMNISKISGAYKNGVFIYSIEKLDPQASLILEGSKKDAKYPDIIKNIQIAHAQVVKKYKLQKFNSLIIKSEDKILFDNTKTS